MNTNGNVYTVIYTAIVVVVVAAALAFTAMSLGPKQSANVKAEALSQMMVAAQLGTMDEFKAIGNDAVLAKYSEEIAQAFTVGLDGEKIGELGTSKDNIELIDNLKPQNVAITKNSGATLPVYVFKSGLTVIPVYGAGLWGPIWGYIALQPDLRTIAGAYFDHASETPGLGAKIKDEPWFREQFIGKQLDLTDAQKPFDIVKGGAPEGAQSAVDAITGATITSQRLGSAIDTWVVAYKNYLSKVSTSTEE